MSNEHLRVELARLLIEIHKLNSEIAFYRSQLRQFSFESASNTRLELVISQQSLVGNHTSNFVPFFS